MRWIVLGRITGIVLIGLVLFSGQVWSQAEQNDRQQLRSDKRPAFKKESSIRKPETLSRETGIAINWRALKVTPEQQAQMQQLRRDFQINTAKVRQELQFVQQDLRAEMLKNPFDRPKIDGLVKEISQMKREISDSAIQNLLAIRGLLSPEQREKLANSQSRLPGELQTVQLTAEQRSQIRDLIKNSLKENRAISAEVLELKEELRDILIETEDIDREKLTQLQGSITEKEFALEQARIEGLLEIWEILTPEQWEQVHKSPIKKQQRVPKTLK